MCNLYSHRSNLQAITDLVGTLRNGAGNLPPQPNIFPDYPAPIVRMGVDGERELVLAVGACRQCEQTTRHHSTPALMCCYTHSSPALRAISPTLRSLQMRLADAVAGQLTLAHTSVSGNLALLRE